MAEVRETQASVVLVGRMNPLIFQPEWLRAHKVIGQAEADAAKEGGIEVIHPDLTSIKLAAMKLVVEEQRFVVTALEEPLVRARDFAVNCFRLVPHMPAQMLGMNYHTVFRAKDAAAWHAFGDTLAPKAPWAGFLSADDPDSRVGGLRNLVMERSNRPDGRKGFIRVTVEALETGHAETKVTYNDHYQLGDENGMSTAGDAAKIIEELWESSVAEAQKVTAQLMEAADGV